MEMHPNSLCTVQITVDPEYYYSLASGERMKSIKLNMTLELEHSDKISCEECNRLIASIYRRYVVDNYSDSRMAPDPDHHDDAWESGLDLTYVESIENYL